MGASYRPENPFAQGGARRPYRPENPFAKADFSGIEGGSSTDAPPEPSLFDKIAVRNPSLGLVFAGARGPGRAALHGASLSTSDEIVGAARALPDIITGTPAREALGRGIDAERASLARYQEEHPTAARVAEITGAVGSGFAGGAALQTIRGAKAAQGASILVRGRQAAGAGAAAGAIAGAGGEEGGVEERAGGALRGAAGGALLGGAVPIVGATASRSIDRLRIGNAKDKAVRKVLEALGRDRKTPADVRTAANRLPARPESIMEVSGENMVGLGRGAQSVPGRAKDEIADVLRTRADEQMTRIVDDVESALGQRRQNVFQKAEDLIATKKAKAQALYDRAYKNPPIDDPVVRQAFELPAFRAAYSRAQRIAKAEGNPLPDIGKDGKISVRGIDLTKRGLDDLIESRMRSGKMGRTEARALRKKLNDVLAVVDSKIDDYRVARAEFAGDSALEDALQAGRDFMKQDARLTASEIRALSAGEKELYRLGALDAIRKRMDDAADGRDLARTIFGSPERRAQLRALFDDDKAFEVFQDTMERETRMASVKNTVLGGSPTARIQAEQGDLGEMLSTAADVATGNVPGLGRRVANIAIGNRLSRIDEAVTNELAPLLTAGATGGNKRLAALARVLERAEREAARRARAGDLTTRSVGAGVGGAQAPNTEYRKRDR